MQNKFASEVCAKIDIKSELRGMGLCVSDAPPTPSGWIAVSNPYRTKDNTIACINIGAGPHRGYMLMFHPNGAKTAASFWDLARDFSPAVRGGETKEIMKHYANAAPDHDSNLSIISADVHPLTKRFELVDGVLTKTPAANVSRGDVIKKHVASLAALAEVVTGLNSGQALCYGVTNYGWADIVTKDQTKSNGSGIVSRTREYFEWPEGKGWMIFDIDPAPDAPALRTTDAVRGMLTGVCPELATAPMLIRPSAGSYIYNGDEQLIGAKGWRAWVLVKNACDIPRAGKAFFDRAWLTGSGFIGISKAGSFLIRGPVDDSVWQPERLDFAGPAVCETPLEQRRPEPVLYNKEAEAFDTQKVIVLTPDEEKQLKEIIEKAKVEKAPEAKQTKQKWIDAQVSAALQVEPTADEARRQQITDLYRSAALQSSIFAEFKIKFTDGTAASVQEILDNKKKYHLKYCLDPLEPELPDSKARLHLLNVAKPHLWSYLHGGRRFILTRARKEFQIEKGERNQLAADLLQTAAIDGTLYTRGELVRVTDTGEIMPVNTDALTFYLDGMAKFKKFNAKENEWKAADCPRDVAVAFTVCAKQSGKLPQLVSVVNHPVIDPSTGRLINRDGYDNKTGLLLFLNGETWPDIPEKPTHAQCRDAAEQLFKPFVDFPFDTDVDRGVFVAGLLTAVVRPLLETAPGFAMTAPTPGTGKTLLARCIQLLSGDRRPAVTPGGSGDDEEIRKKLFTFLREGARTIIFDNINGVFSSDSICAALTFDLFKDRVLGVSDSMTVSTASTLILTGNNLTMAGDLCRRVLTCRVDAQDEKPHKRQFLFDPAQYVTKHRTAMLYGALTLIRGGLQSNHKLKDGTGSFKGWNDSIRKTVCWIGAKGFLNIDDPNKSIESSYEQDPETCKLSALLNAWAETFVSPQSVASAIMTAKLHPTGNLFNALYEIGGEGRETLNARRIGRWIEKNRDRRVNGTWFHFVSGTGGVKNWQTRSL